jgi:FMN phosphatase YigB (HAD superfamily)
MSLFDHVIESAKIGLRKPDPRIYKMMTEALGVDYLDDLGVNLKPAREMGMTTKCSTRCKRSPNSRRRRGWHFDHQLVSRVTSSQS